VKLSRRKGEKNISDRRKCSGSMRSRDESTWCGDQSGRGAERKMCQGIKSKMCFNVMINEEHLNEFQVLLGSHKLSPTSQTYSPVIMR